VGEGGGGWSPHRPCPFHPFPFHGERSVLACLSRCPALVRGVPCLRAPSGDRNQSCPAPQLREAKWEVQVCNAASAAALSAAAAGAAVLAASRNLLAHLEQVCALPGC
jgi:hypothetical protein